MTMIQINGIGFETATVWSIDRVDVSFAPNPGDSTTSYATVYDPSGPNAGNDTPGVTIDTWSNTLIEISFNSEDFDLYVADVSYFDETLTYSALFDVSPDQPTVVIPTITSVQEDYGNNVRGDLEVLGTNLSGHGHVVVYYDNDASYIGFTNPAGGPLSLILQNDSLAGETISSIEIYESFPNINLLLAFSGGNLPFAMSDFPYRFSYDSGLDELTIDQTVGYNFNNIDFINYASNGSGQLDTSNWTVNSSSQIVISNASFVLNGGPVTDLTFIDGVTIVSTWSDANPIQGYPSGSIYLI